MEIAICAETNSRCTIEKGLLNFCGRTGIKMGGRIFYKVEELFYALKEKSFDVVFIALNGARGMEVATKVREWNPFVSLVWVSNDIDFGPSSYRLGVKLFLVQPLTSKQVEDALERCQGEEKTDLLKWKRTQ